MRRNSTIIILFFLFGCMLFSSFETKKDDLTASMARGKQIYNSYCVSCHMSAGEGLDGVFPALAKSTNVMNLKTSVTVILKGKGTMSSQPLNDQQTADVLNYIRNSWGNKGAMVLATDVKANK